MSTGLEVNSSEGSPNGICEEWNVNLSEVDIRLMGTRAPGNHAPVNNWKIQLRGKQVVYTAFYRSGIDEAMQSRDSGRWQLSGG